ncbi:MAG: lysine biosynthesis protein LysW [Candidatus Thorarchaeota archaeon]
MAQQTVTTLSSECIVCGCILNLNNDVEIGELLECSDCGTELEVISIEPLSFEEAPMEGEDWGE